MKMKFEEHFNQAEKLIDETDYHQRDDELEEPREIKRKMDL